jgi:hypothetical protein
MTLALDIPYLDAAVDPATAVDLPDSACTVPEVQMQNRIDPYWAAVWAAGAQASWVSEDLAKKQVAAGIGRLPSHLEAGATQVLDALPKANEWSRRLNALSVIDSWRTVTGEQMAAITGDAALATGQSQVMAELFQAGAADVGVFSNGLFNGRNTARAALYRPSRTTAFDRDIAPHMTYPEWVSVTAGQPWESGSQFDRHNVLATELALRVAEFCEIGAVVGEKLSSWELLAHSGAGFPEAVGRNRAADATLIRTDGARIAVEMTASTGKHFEDKVRRWAGLLANRRFADTGLAVVFVVAPRPDRKIRAGEYVTMVRKFVAAAARDNPGVSFDRTAWQDWFPAAHEASAEFTTLQAWRPTGAAGDPWQSASLLDPFDLQFDPRDEAAALAVLDNLSGVRSVPYWLRTGRPKELWPRAIKQLGFRGIPVPVPARPEVNTGKALGAANGAAGQTQPPRRLQVVLD